MGFIFWEVQGSPGGLGKSDSLPATYQEFSPNSKIVSVMKQAIV